MLQLKVLKGPTSVGQMYALQSSGPSMIGRGQECAIRLNSAGVSKTHARLTVISGSRVEVEDLGSSNGTYVNGVLIRRQLLKPGDTVTIHDYVLQISKGAPRMAGAPSGMSQSESFSMNIGDAPAQAVPVNQNSAGEKIITWLEENVYPWADRLSGQYDVRLLFVGFFLFWSLLVVFFTAAPFRERANTRVQEQSIEVAKLYARQLVRVNQLAILEQRYKDLVVTLDSRLGATPGLVGTYIFDSVAGRILAPQERINEGLPNTYAAKAVAESRSFVQISSDGLAYVSEPILVSTPEGKNEIAATVMIVFDSVSGQFSAATLVDQALTSLIFCLIISSLFILFLYRWIDGSLTTLAVKIDSAVKNGDITIAAPVKWPAIADLCEQVGFLLGRASGAQDPLSGGDAAWAIAAVDASGCAAAAFSGELKVMAWNPRMEKLIGIRASMALGNDISAASRDIAFETAIRELQAETGNIPSTPAFKDIEFSGLSYKIAMVSGQGASLVTIAGSEA